MSEETPDYKIEDMYRQAATDRATADGRMLGTFYIELVKKGIHPSEATTVTIEYMNNLFEDRRVQ